MKKIASTKTLLVGVLCFILFLVAACALYIVQHDGTFPAARLAAVYAVLGALGGLAIVFRRYAFAGLFWGGTVLGYASGSYVGGLKGDFAPTAGLIVLIGCIVLFGAVGAVVEVKRIGRARRKEKERRAAEQTAEAERQRQLMAEQEERSRAAQNAAAPAADAPPEPAEPSPAPQEGPNQ